MNEQLARAASAVVAGTRRVGAAALRNWWIVLSLIPLVAIGLCVAYVASLMPQTPTVGDLKKVRNEQPSIVLTSDGQEITALRRANRQWVTLQDMSPHVLDALLATEDHRFFSHKGLDLWRTASAALHTAAGKLQGGSTITQQLARNLYPEEIGRAPTIERKVKEAITALKIESLYGKHEILEIYLNTVPFLYNAYGIEMAARTYFDKTARELDVLEAATLVGMLKGTTYYNPVLNPARAKQRRNIVLSQMAKHGKLQEQELASLTGAPLRLDFEKQDEGLGPAPHLAVMVRRWLIDWADRKGYNVYADGLVVRTTLDSRAQEMAVAAVADQMDRMQKLVDAHWSGRNGWSARRDLLDLFIRESAQFQAARAAGVPEQEALAKLRAEADFLQALREDKTRLQAGFVAIEPGTGLVRAWVGSRDFAVDQYDHVQQARRQPGSTFKPFVYGAAFELGARPEDMLIDQMVDIPLGPGETWRPGDVSQPTNEPVTLRDALAMSKNTVTAQLVARVGPGKLAQVARALGVRDSRLHEVYSLALGTSPVSLREMVSAYGAIANNGHYVAPTIVARVEDRNGKVLESFAPAAPEPGLDPAANGILLDAMRAVVERGTATPIRSRYGLRGDLAGKTGTSQDNMDGWFILAHPQLVGGAWVGFNDSRITMRDPWGQGARSALPIVGDVFRQLTRARLIDSKARFPEAPDPASLDGARQWWASVYPPPQLPQAPVLAGSTPELFPADGGVQPAVVVAPPRSAPQFPPPNVATPPIIAAPQPVQRAIVVAPPRGPTGEASGAGAAPAMPGFGSGP
jgi:penicillin-binding protein 1A